MSLRAIMGGKRSRLLIVLGAVAVVAIVVMASLAFQAAPAKVFRSSTDGFRVGDHFYYDAIGTYNGTPVLGLYSTTLTHVYSNGGGGYCRLNSTAPELDALLNRYLTMWNLFGAYVIGTGKFATPYGVKEVVQLFDIFPGFTAVYYVGWEPQAIYGCVVNGPDLHLELRLNSTNNPYAISNNTEPVAVSRQNTPTPSGPAGVSATGNSWSGSHYYSPHGARITYDFTANGSNLYAYTEANVRSMADGGPYAYFPALTRIGAGKETGEAFLPPGEFYLFCQGREWQNEHAYFIVHIEAY
ncbi:hypothetical protein AOA80_08945 [Methanomassiliicoccales archaeon RumEn M1]|jgi:hypothetical protein|nr:hypothetical protein AOA80_08945 [Methanomassiliicoccales archaeon RumEn M1]